MSLCKNHMSLKPSIIQIIDEGIVINYVVVEVRVKIVQVFNLDLSSIRSRIFHNIIQIAHGCENVSGSVELNGLGYF